MRMNGVSYYVWHYGTEEDIDMLNVRMFEKTDTGDMGGIVGEELNSEQTVRLNNDLIVTMLENQDMSVAGFECDGWWYIVSYVGDKEMLTEILEGMVIYE
jgi:hypothetical protein